MFLRPSASFYCMIHEWMMMNNSYCKSLWCFLLVIVVILSTACSQIEPVEPVSFEQVASVPVGRASAVSFAVGGNGYVLGGRTSAKGGYLSDFWKYDPTANDWTRLPDPPFKARVNAVAQVVDDKVFVGLGYNGGGVYKEDSYQRDWWMYNSLNGVWERKADYPTLNTAGASAFVCESGIVVCFGFFSFFTNEAYLYDIDRDEWIDMEWPYMSPAGETIAGVVNGRYYAGLCSDWHEYIENSGKWERRASYKHSEGRQMASQLTVDGHFFMIGGREWYAIKVSDEICEYLPDADKWVLRGYLPKSGVENLVAFEVDGVAYVGLGENEEGEVLADFYRMIIP